MCVCVCVCVCGSDGVFLVILQVAEGFDVLSKINEAYCDKDGHPFQDIRIYHTVVLDDPFPDLDGEPCMTYCVKFCVCVCVCVAECRA